MAEARNDTGFMQVNGTFVTRVQFKIDTERAGKEFASVRFMRGADEVAQLKLDQAELVTVLGARNVTEINKVVNDSEPDEPKVYGELKDKTLHYRDIAPPQQAPESVSDTPRSAAEEENAIKVTRLRVVLQNVRETERVAAEGDIGAKVFETEKPGAKAAPQASDGKDKAAPDDKAKASPDGKSEAFPDTKEQAADKDERARKAEADRVRAESAVPAHIAGKYIVVDNKYQFDEKLVAFVDKGSSFTTKVENVAVIKDLVAIAKERGWGEAEVRGTQQFRKEVWKEAYAEGIEIKGYKPSEAERVMAEAERTKRHGRDGFANSREGPLSDKPGEPNASDKPAAQEGTKTNPRERVVYGKLVGHGEAPYQHDSKNADSAFVKVQFADGSVRTLWGVGLREAMNESQTQAKVGDVVGVQRVASHPVTVTERVVNEQGQMVSRSIETHRNEWLVEKADYFKQPDRIAVDLAARRSRSEETDVVRKDSPASKDLAEKVYVQGTTDAVMVSTRPTVAEPSQSAGAGNNSASSVGAPDPRQERAAAIRAADMTRHELERRYPDLGEAVFKNMDSHQRFADAFVKAGIYRAEDRAQVIAAMNERLAGKVERGEPVELLDDRKASNLIRQSVLRAGADNVRGAETVAKDRVAERVRTPTPIVHDDAHVRA